MSITATTPQLVYIEPGIQVVVDSDVPIFYSDSFYWRYEGDVWYRSHAAAGGWVRHDSPPQHLRRIKQPQQYAHYRPKDREPVVRDHRTPAPAPHVRDRQPPPPIVRDHQPTPDRDHDRGNDDRDKGRDNDRDKGRDNDRGKDKDRDRDKDKDKDKHRPGH